MGERIVTSETRLRRVLLRLLAPERVVEVLEELREVAGAEEKPSEADRTKAEKYLRRAGAR